MMMITRRVDPQHFVLRARQIQAQIPIILSQWGLVSKFKRWRLAQDPETGTVVLFGVLNNQFIATHTTTPFSNYFDPRLLCDMAKELHVPIIPSANDGLRYAFILERGQVREPPASVEEPFIMHISDDGLPTSGVQTNFVEIRIETSQSNIPAPLDPHTVIHQRLDRFLKIAEALDAQDKATQPMPDILLADEAEFEQKLAEYEAARHENQF